MRNLLARPQFAAASAFAQFTQFVQLQQVGAQTQLQIDVDGVGTDTNYTTLAILKNVAINSVTSRQLVQAR